MLLEANQNITITALTDSNQNQYALTSGQTLDLSIHESQTIAAIILQLNEDYGSSAYDIKTGVGGEIITDPANANQGYTLPFHASVNQNTGLINQTTTFEDYVILTFVAPETGSYRFDWHYLWSYNSTSSDFRAEILLDTTKLLEHREEPQDSGGSGVVLNNTSGGTNNTGTDQKRQESGFCIEENLSAGTHTFKIQFCGSSNNQEATIYNAHLAVTRV